MTVREWLRENKLSFADVTVLSREWGIRLREEDRVLDEEVVNVRDPETDEHLKALRWGIQVYVR